MKLTQSQMQTYRYLIDYTQEHLFPPTIREICAATGLTSTSTIVNHLHRLEKEGLIQVTSGEPRGIKLCGYSLVSNEKLISLIEAQREDNE